MFIKNSRWSDWLIRGKTLSLWILVLLSIIMIEYGDAHNLSSAPFLLVSRDVVEPHPSIHRNMTIEARIYNLGNL